MPAILEYIPYRKNDATAVRDAGIHPYFAGHGYASVRVDLRGSGDSDGHPRGRVPAARAGGRRRGDPLARRPAVVHGRRRHDRQVVGRLQRAPDRRPRPPELQAVVSVCSTDDRYADDVHYIGGCVFGAYMLSWASTMLAFNARPPDPAVVGERWREQWLERLEQTPPFVEAWLSHQRRDEYWKQGSVCEDYGAIRCPVYMVGGWADGYPNAILRFLAGYAGPAEGPDRPVGAPLSARRAARAGDRLPAGGAALVGPLAEGDGDRDHGGADAAGLDARARSRRARATRSGRAAGWPSPPGLRRASRRAGSSSPHGGLEQEPGDPVELALRGSDAHGLESGTWVAWGSAVDFAPDQRAEDGRSLCFTSAAARRAPRAARLPGGGAHARLGPAVRAASRRGSATWRRTARRRWSPTGVLNLTHRESHEHPQPLVPGQPRRGDGAAEGDRVRLPARAPYPPRALPHVLAVGLALARAGHPDRPDRRRVRAPASRPRRRARRTTCSLPSRSPRAPRRSRSRSPSPAARHAHGSARRRHGPVGARRPTCVYFGSVPDRRRRARALRSGAGTRSRSSRETRSRRRRARTGRSRSVAATGARGSRPRAG